MSTPKHYLLDAVEADQFNLWAIHSSLLPYQIAFALNKYCQTHFTHFHPSHSDKTTEYPFERYHWNCLKKGIHLELIANTYMLEEKKMNTAFSLFDVPQTKEVYLVPKLKNVDYFLLEYHPISFINLKEKLPRVNSFEMVYRIETNEQPAELNLIFD